MAVREAFARRIPPGEALAVDAPQLRRACHDMAERFHGGGRLIVFGNGGTATDAQHIVVEFVHPVVVGKPTLPALCLTNDPATVTGIAMTDGFDEVFATQLGVLAAPGDIALGLSADGDCPNVRRGLDAARRLGMLTVALVGGDGGGIAHDGAADHILRARSQDHCIVKEVFVTTYHILWELVHVVLEHLGPREPEVPR
jgi:D-sedoheptulose 7-phosphate isomerase